MRVFEMAFGFKVSGVSVARASAFGLILGGTALGAAACSEDPPPPPAAAFNIQFTGGANPGDCRIMTHTALLGQVSSGGTPSTIPHGKDGVSTKCTVEKSGGNFKMTVQATSNGYSFGANVGSFPSTATPDAPAVGTVTYISPQTQDNFVGTDCKFWLFPDQGQYVKDGSVWFTFSCDALTSEGRTCGMTASYAKFDNCNVGTAEEDE